MHGSHYDEESGGFALSFCTATDPTQLYVLEAAADTRPARKTRERVLGHRPGAPLSRRGCVLRLARRPTRLRPVVSSFGELGYDGPRPLVYYVHGGPQGQERPNFAWFSMPLIQILTLQGFAVFVPNVRGSTGYGLDYTKRVDRTGEGSTGWITCMR